MIIKSIVVDNGEFKKLSFDLDFKRDQEGNIAEPNIFNYIKKITVIIPYRQTTVERRTDIQPACINEDGRFTREHIDIPELDEFSGRDGLSKATIVFEGQTSFYFDVSFELDKAKLLASIITKVIKKSFDEEISKITYREENIELPVVQ